jgi:N-acetylglucosamine kinase-like BadF-type ATPase
VSDGGGRPAVLAIDAGGSKVDVALVERSGRVVGVARWPRAVPGLDAVVADGRSAAIDGTGEAIAAACRDAGLDPSRLPVAAVGVYCVAGADLPADDRRIGKEVRAHGWTTTDVVLNDTFAVLRAGSDRGWGVAVVCGHGINCSGVAPDGRTFRFPAIGHVSGDWGGGVDLGSSALWHAVRAQDGRGPATELARLVPAQFGLDHPRRVVEAIHFGRISERRLTELAPVIFLASARGDAVALGVADRQADEIVAMAVVAMRRLRLTRLDVEVILGGGVFRAEDPAFFARIEEGVRAVSPAAAVRVLAEPPVVGAALLGLDRLGVPRRAAERARRALTHERFLGQPVAPPDRR